MAVRHGPSPGALGDDVVNPLGLERPNDLCGPLAALGLLGECPVRVMPDEDPMPVSAGGGREPKGPRGILLETEASREDGPSGIVDGCEEVTDRLRRPEPGIRAALVGHRRP